MALDRRNYKALVETTVALANKVGWGRQERVAGGCAVPRAAHRRAAEPQPLTRPALVASSLAPLRSPLSQVGCADIVSRVVEDLKDESEPYRRMVMETIDKVGGGS
jgi:hypothetical protein